MKKTIASILGVPIVENFGQYLGLPSKVGRNRKNVFQTVKDRVWKKIKGWRGPLLVKKSLLRPWFKTFHHTL